MLNALLRVHDRHGEKIRFLVVGGWNTLFGIAVLWVLDRYIPYDPGNLVQKQLLLVANWLISVTHNFVTFKFIVFRSRGPWLREYGRVYVTYVTTFLIQSVMTLLISEVFGLRVFWANLPTIVVVAVVSYLGHKHFTFRRHESSGPAAT